MGGIIAQNVPLEGLTEQGQRDARPAEAGAAQPRKGGGQELQQQVFQHRDGVGHDDEQAALPHPFCQFGMAFGKAAPPVL